MLIGVYIVVAVFCLVSALVKLPHVFLADALLVYSSELVLTMVVVWIVFIVTKPRDCSET